MSAPSGYTASFMSDTKWRRFFTVAAENPQKVWYAVWKLIREDEKSGWLPDTSHKWDEAVDGCLNGPVDYRLIEWIEIPRRVAYRKYDNAPASYRAQEIATFRAALAAVGQFQIEDTERGLRVYGYK